MHVNLVPASLALRMLILRRLRMWGRLWLAVIAVLVVILFVQYRSLSREQQQLALWRKRAQPVHILQAESESLKQRQSDLTKHLNTLQSLQPTDHTLDLLGVIGTAAQAAGAPLQVRYVRVTINTSRPPMPGVVSSPASPTNVSCLNLSGITTGDMALARFSNALRSSNVFTQVDLKSSSQWRADGFEGREFQLECRLAE